MHGEEGGRHVHPRHRFLEIARGAHGRHREPGRVRRHQRGAEAGPAAKAPRDPAAAAVERCRSRNVDRERDCYAAVLDDALAGAASREADGGGLPLAEERELPTAEELGEEFERFLAGLDPDDE